MDSLRMRAVIVDDEFLGRTVIREMLRRDPTIDIVGECANGHEAIAALRTLSPDLVFLDVHMPELDGFEVLASLAPARLPLVIFVTAHDRFAVRAFEVHAVDYLLKPFDRERFDRALSRAKAHHHSNRGEEVNQRILALLEERTPPRRLERIAIKARGRVLFLKIDEIDWIEAEGNYIRLHVRHESYLLRETIGGIEGQLDPRQFPRIHRSRIVNIDRVRELHPWSHGEYHVILHDGTKLTLSRSYRDRLHALMGKSL